jgi:drug/metabolite transporter (DMT)-like permease
VTKRKQIDGFAVWMMILLCAVWGLHQVAIKMAAPDIAPIIQIALRSGISALLVAVVMMCGWGNFNFRDGTLCPGIIVGILFASEFLCVAEGLRFTSASHMAVFLYTAPVFTALGLHICLPAEKLRLHQWLGIAIAFGGIATAFTGGTQFAGFSSRILWGDFLGVLAGAGWGVTTVIIRCTSLSEAPPTKTLLYQLVAAFLLLSIYGVCSGQAATISMTKIAWASLLFQGLIITFASYLTWFWLLRRYLASRLAVFSFMSPLFGVSFGVIILHDSVDTYFAIGAIMVLTGISIVSRSQFIRPSVSKLS